METVKVLFDKDLLIKQPDEFPITKKHKSENSELDSNVGQKINESNVLLENDSNDDSQSEEDDKIINPRIKQYFSQENEATQIHIDEE